MRSNQKELGRSYIEKAIANITGVYWIDDIDYDSMFDIDEYFNELIKGIHVTTVVLQIMRKEMEGYYLDT